MALTSIQKNVWAARLNANLNKVLVYGSLCNTNYTADSANASVVKINAVGAITVQDYVGTGSLIRTNASSTSKDLTLDQKKYTFTNIPADIAATSDISIIDGVMEESAYAISDQIDQYVAGFSSSFNDITTQVTSSDAISNAGTITHIQSVGTTAAFVSASAPASQSAISTLSRLAEVLDKQNVPAAGRFVVVPAWFNSLLARETAWETAAPSILANGIVSGQNVSGLQVFMSNNTPGVDSVDNTIIAGHPRNWTLARQLSEMKVVEADDDFGKQLKLLYIYGAQVLQSSGFATMHANKF